MIIVEIFKILGTIIASAFVIAVFISAATILSLFGAMVFKGLVAKDDDNQHYDRP